MLLLAVCAACVSVAGSSARRHAARRVGLSPGGEPSYFKQPLSVIEFFFSINPEVSTLNRFCRVDSCSGNIGAFTRLGVLVSLFSSLFILSSYPVGLTSLLKPPKAYGPSTLTFLCFYICIAFAVVW